MNAIFLQIILMNSVIAITWLVFSFGYHLIENYFAKRRKEKEFEIETEKSKRLLEAFISKNK